MNCLTWLRRSELSCETNMFLAIARVIRYVTGSTVRLVSNWYNRGDYLPYTHSGEPGTMRPRNNILNLKKLAPISFLVPIVLLGQQAVKPQGNGDASDSADTVFTTETRLVQLPVTVTDKNGRLVTTLPQSAFEVFENNALQTIKLFKRED